MKKILFLSFSIFLINLVFASYIISNKDEGSETEKYYGEQLEQATAWRGYKILIDTTTKIYEYNYIQGISTTTYSDWWNARKSTTTIYHNGFEYKKHIYS